jgi:hypothetical protein
VSHGNYEYRCILAAGHRMAMRSSEFGLEAKELELRFESLSWDVSDSVPTCRATPWPESPLATTSSFLAWGLGCRRA